MKNFQYISIALTLTTLLIGCGQTGTVGNDSKIERTTNNASLIEIQDEGLSYLNTLRVFVDMIPLEHEVHLEEASQNHAMYLTSNNLFTHIESANKSGFTGVTPSDRTRYAGYEHAIVGENISSSNRSVKESIDTLFSAIYHRFAFLNYDYDELGIGFSQSDVYSYGNVYNYNMGISPLRVLCEETGVVNGGAYYENICF